MTIALANLNTYCLLILFISVANNLKKLPKEWAFFHFWAKWISKFKLVLYISFYRDLNEVLKESKKQIKNIREKEKAEENKNKGIIKSWRRENGIGKLKKSEKHSLNIINIDHSM